jgi:hypothetical protein
VSDRTCAAGDRCCGYDRPNDHAALLADPRTLLCGDCLTVAERDARLLLFDYIDLEQLLPVALTQALDTQSGYGGSREPPVPLRVGVDELQRTIWWVTTCWAEVLVERHRLADPPYQRRVRDADPQTRVRDGYAVAWAVGVLSPRLPDLARVEPVELADYPLVDPEDATRHGSLQLAELPGAVGVLHLMRLHGRARAALGRVRRTTRVPGRCGCGQDGNFLYRDEPKFERDPCPVYCGACTNRWTPEQYEKYVGLMQLHPELADVEGMDYEPAPAGAPV